jgi:hypothetical protein
MPKRKIALGVALAGLMAGTTWAADPNRFSGVTLPILGYPGGGFTREFVQHPSFAENLCEMDWNTLRLQVVWSFLDSQEKVDEAILTLKDLVALLDRVRGCAGQSRYYLIVDFHQFRFGPDCGGHGIPTGRIPPPTATPSDLNCPFLAFESFWRDAGLRAEWTRFAMQFVAELPDVADNNRDWLTIGIEPMNEPVAGSQVRLFDGNPVQQAIKVWQYVASGQPRQIDSRLLPFYREFLQAVADTVPPQRLATFLGQTFFVMDPFLFDHLAFTVPIGGGITIGSDGSYSNARSLKTLSVGGTSYTANWLAGPHHYVGAYDSANPIPTFGSLGKYLLYSPTNPFVNRAQMERRFQKWDQRFRTEAGMHVFVGEYGTFTRLPAYKAWIQDVNEFAGRYTLGALWFQYRQDLFTDDQASYNLLRRFDDYGTPYALDMQRLKCGEPFGNIVETIFGRCVDPYVGVPAEPPVATAMPASALR